MRRDQLTERLPGIISMHDDICIFRKTQQEHDQNLLQLMKTASKNGLVFNGRKFYICQPQIAFSIFSANGIKPNPAKIQALQDILAPNNHTKLQSFLDLINYLLPFCQT